MSPYWRREDAAELREARQIQVELAEAAAILTTVAGRLSALAAELNEEAEAVRQKEGRT